MTIQETCCCGASYGITDENCTDYQQQFIKEWASEHSGCKAKIASITKTITETEHVEREAQ